MAKDSNRCDLFPDIHCKDAEERAKAEARLAAANEKLTRGCTTEDCLICDRWTDCQKLQARLAAAERPECYGIGWCRRDNCPYMTECHKLCDRVEARFKDRIASLEEKLAAAQLDLASVKTAHEHCESWCPKLAAATAAYEDVRDRSSKRVASLEASLAAAEKHGQKMWEDGVATANKQDAVRVERIKELEAVVERATVAYTADRETIAALQADLSTTKAELAGWKSAARELERQIKERPSASVPPEGTLGDVEWKSKRIIRDFAVPYYQPPYVLLSEAEENIRKKYLWVEYWKAQFECNSERAVEGEKKISELEKKLARTMELMEDARKSNDHWLGKFHWAETMWRAAARDRDELCKIAAKRLDTILELETTKKAIIKEMGEEVAAHSHDVRVKNEEIESLRAAISSRGPEEMKLLKENENLTKRLTETLAKLAGKQLGEIITGVLGRPKRVRRIYVAGPYSADNVMTVLRNIREGIKMAETLLARGYSPFCPWLDYHFEFYGDHPVADYYRYSMDFLECCDAVLTIGDWSKSKGVIAEVARAKELGIPVFNSIADVENYKRETEKNGNA
jgi:hypothetical protein